MDIHIEVIWACCFVGLQAAAWLSLARGRAGRGTDFRPTCICNMDLAARLSVRLHLIHPCGMLGNNG